LTLVERERPHADTRSRKDHDCAIRQWFAELAKVRREQSALLGNRHRQEFAHEHDRGFGGSLLCEQGSEISVGGDDDRTLTDRAHKDFVIAGASAQQAINVFGGVSCRRQILAQPW